MKKAKLLSVGLCLALALTACGKTSKETSVTLGNYKGVEVSVLPVEVTDEDIQAEIDSLLASYPKFVEYDRTDVQDGDIANIDYTGSIDGTEFEGGSSTGFDLTIGSGSFIDDFEQQLIGHKVGETVDVNVTFPTEYSSNSDLAGKEALFVVKINKIGYNEAAVLNDEFVKEYTDSETVEDYKKSVQEDLQSQLQESSDSQKELDVMTKIVEDSKFSNLSQDEIDTTVEDMNSYYESMASYSGMDYATFKSLYFGMDEETFTKELAAAAELQVKQKYVLEAIADKENLSFTEEEYQTKLAEYATSYGAESPEAFEEENGKDKVEQSILSEKALQFVVDNAVVVESTETEEATVTPTVAPTTTSK